MQTQTETLSPTHTHNSDAFEIGLKTKRLHPTTCFCYLIWNRSFALLVGVRDTSSSMENRRSSRARAPRSMNTEMKMRSRALYNANTHRLINSVLINWLNSPTWFSNKSKIERIQQHTHTHNTSEENEPNITQPNVTHPIFPSHSKDF